MKVFTLKRTDNIGYDETIALTVVAEHEKHALQIGANTSWGDWIFTPNHIEVKEVDLSKPGIIMQEYING